MQASGFSLRHLARSVSSMAIVHMVSMGLAFAIGVLLAQSLGPAGYGTYALALSIASLVGLVTEFGLPTLLVREVASATQHGDWSRMSGVLRWSDRMVLIGSALTTLILLVVWYVNRDRSEFTASLGWAALLIPVVAIAKLRGGALLALGRTVLSQVPVLILRPGLFALALLVVALIPNRRIDASTAMMFQVVSAALAMAVAVMLFRSVRPSELRRVDPAFQPRVWLAAAFPMALTEGLRAAQVYIAIFILGLLGTLTSVGLYRVADATAAICFVPVTLLSVIASPTIARLHSMNDRAGLQHYLGLVSVAATAGIALLSLPLLFEGELLLGLAFGREFASAQPALTILCLGNIAATALGPVAVYMNMTGGERSVSRTCAISLAVNLALAFALVPQFGSVGAAIANVTGFFLWSLLLFVEVYRRDGLNASIAGFRTASRPAS
jgi:O-antigen/teichoic acid export membrane protein